MKPPHAELYYLNFFNETTGKRFTSHLTYYTYYGTILIFHIFSSSPFHLMFLARAEKRKKGKGESEKMGNVKIRNSNVASVASVESEKLRK